MRINHAVEFEFSGCEYHPPAPAGVAFDLEMAKRLLGEAGHVDPSQYQLNMYRDLLLEFARSLAKDFRRLEPTIQEDVVRRKGTKVAPPA